MTTNMDCSFVRENSPCGSVGTESLVLPVDSCKLDVTSYLVSLGISLKRGWRSSGTITERDLILNRAGHFDLNEEAVASMTICPKHRRELTVEWPGRKRLVCGYPIHKGKNKQILSPRRINMTTSHEIFKMHGVIVPAGTCKNSRFCIIQIRFDCQPFCNGFFFFTSLELTANCIKYSYTISKKELISYNVVEGEWEGEGGKYLAQFLGTSCWNQCKKNRMLYCCDVLNIPFYQESINKRGKLRITARAISIHIRAIFSNRMQFNFRLTLLARVKIRLAQNFAPYSRASKMVCHFEFFCCRKFKPQSTLRNKFVQVA